MTVKTFGETLESLKGKTTGPISADAEEAIVAQAEKELAEEEAARKKLEMGEEDLPAEYK
mgnify:CR=1 FL=1